MVDDIAFHVDTELMRLQPQRNEIAYRLDVNEWPGRRSIQLMVMSFLNVEI